VRKKLSLLALVIGTLLLTTHWENLRFKLTRLQENIAEELNDGEERRVVYLYGPDLCITCRAREVLAEMKRDEEVVFVFEHEVSDGEIENFMRSFELIGTPLRGTPSVDTYLERLAATMPSPRWRKNYIVDYRGTGLVAFTTF